VREIAPQAAGDSRTYRVRATLPDTIGDSVPLGSSATASFDTPVALLAVPMGALLKGDDGKVAVWVVDAARTARLKTVTPGPLQGNQATIAAGLAPGEWVITAGVHDLRDGQPVSLPANPTD
jgi:multidrug efflux pump subunit AcrA (membrane-fusion protein)